MDKQILPAGLSYLPQWEKHCRAVRQLCLLAKLWSLHTCMVMTVFVKLVLFPTVNPSLWQAELTFIPFFWISKIFMLDIQNKYFGYRKQRW